MTSRLSTKEASRTLLLLPLLLGSAQYLPAQNGFGHSRLPNAFVASSTPALVSQQATPTRNQSLIFTEAVPRLVVEQSFQFAVAAVNPDGSQVRLTDVTWRSSSPEIATVSRTGMVVARRVGRAFISAVSGRQEVRVRVSVLAPTPTAGNLIASIELTPSTADVEAGTSLQFAASARSADGSLVPEAPVTYAANDTTVARISGAGLLSARSPGQVEITATSGGVSNRVSVTVGRARVASITVTPSPLAMTTADTMPLKVAATRRDGSSAALTDLSPAAQRGTFRGWTYVPPTAAGVDTITVTAADGFAVRVPATIAAVAAPTPPAPAPAPAESGSLPLYTAPARPAASVNVAYPAVTGRTIRVAAGDVAGLQAAINSAVGGDEIVLPNGSDFVGNFELPKRSGSGVVVIRSENVGVPVGTRMTPAAAAGLAKIGTNNVSGAFSTKAGASGWRLTGLHISLRNGAVDNYGIVVLGSGTETTASDFVSNIVLDRVYVTASENNTSRCVALNGNSLAVVDSWLADCHAKGRDAQGIGGWTGVGPFLIQNNHIEGSGQGVMFGGADPKISGVVPSDATIIGNHFFKPLTWGNGKWTVKATFELKNAKRVLFEGNVLENHWMDAQVGYAILFQAANQDGTAPWTTIQDVTVQNNIVRNSTSGINLLSRLESGGPVTDPMQRVLIRNNLFLDVGRDPFNGIDGRFVQMLNDLRDVTLIQNTFLGAVARNAVMFDGPPQIRTTLANNVFGASSYGVFGSGVAEGTAALLQYAPSGWFRGNAVIGRLATSYPMGNMFPATIASSDFVSATAGDYTLRSTLSWSAYGSSVVGVNGQAILDATRRTVTP